MSTWQLALVAILVVLLIGLAWRARRPAAQPTRAADRVDTVIGWPPRATVVMSRHERMAYDILLRAAPECTVLAQVSLSRFIEVPKRNSYADWLRRVGYQSVDFIVCNRATEVLAVVELQAQQPSELAQKRLSRIRRTLKAAQLPLHVWHEGLLPTVDAVRELLVPKQDAFATTAFSDGTAGTINTIGPGAGQPTTAELRPVPPVAEAQLHLEPDIASDGIPFDDLADEEASARREAPPSTWYGDLDSVRVPLDKR